MATITAELGTLKGEILCVIKTRQLDRFIELTHDSDNMLKEIGSDLGIEMKENQSYYNYGVEIFNTALNSNVINFYDNELFN